MKTFNASFPAGVELNVMFVLLSLCGPPYITPKFCRRPWLYLYSTHLLTGHFKLL